MIPRTVIGGFADPKSIEQRVKTLNADIKILDDIMTPEISRIAKKVGKFELSDGEKLAGKIAADFQNYKLDYSAFLADGVYTTDSSALRTYEVRFRDFYNAWRSLPPEIAKPSMGISTLPPAEPGYFDDIPNEKQTTALYVGGGILATLVLWSMFRKR